MQLLLIRHAETVDNVASLYAGTRDSLLTVHGATQAERLGDYLAINLPVPTHIYSSPLKRAAATAEAIRARAVHINASQSPCPAVIDIALLHERDFGYLEGKSFGLKGRVQNLRDRAGAGQKEPETRKSMRVRMSAFFDDYLMPLLCVEQEDRESSAVVFVISHGVILNVLWQFIIDQVDVENLFLAQQLSSQENISDPSFVVNWSNTGFLQLLLKANSKIEVPTVRDRLLTAWTIEIEELGCVKHLQALRRAGGGIGSAAYDHSQRKLDIFFTKSSPAGGNQSQS